MTRLRADRGAVTAEIAVALPSLVLVLAACLAALSLATTVIRAHDAAASAARLLGRGETVSSVVQLVARLVPGAQVSVARPADLVCVSVSVEQRILMIPMRLDTSACALDGGR